MSRKHKKERRRLQAPEQTAEDFGSLSSKGKKIIAAGIATLALGFLLLTRTDPRGQNWASKLCPFLILGGYAVIAAGIVTPDNPPDLKPSEDVLPAENNEKDA